MEKWGGGAGTGVGREPVPADLSPTSPCSHLSRPIDSFSLLLADRPMNLELRTRTQSESCLATQISLEVSEHSLGSCGRVKNAVVLILLNSPRWQQITINISTYYYTLTGF